MGWMGWGSYYWLIKVCEVRNYCFDIFVIIFIVIFVVMLWILWNFYVCLLHCGVTTWIISERKRNYR